MVLIITHFFIYLLTHPLATYPGNAATINQTSGDSIRILKKENHLFLRAALQLLEENELLRVKRNEKYDVSSVDMDVIRYGRLKKAARGGASSFSAIAPLWKWKYVELRHGSYTYEGISLIFMMHTRTHSLISLLTQMILVQLTFHS